MSKQIARLMSSVPRALNDIGSSNRVIAYVHRAAVSLVFSLCNVNYRDFSNSSDHFSQPHTIDSIRILPRCPSPPPTTAALAPTCGFLPVISLACCQLGPLSVGHRNPSTRRRTSQGHVASPPRETDTKRRRRWFTHCLKESVCVCSRKRVRAQRTCSCSLPVGSPRFTESTQWAQPTPPLLC